MNETKNNSQIILEQFELGPMANYVYFVVCAATQKAAVVDPAWDAAFLKETAKKKNYQIVSILLTHGHPDHIEGVEAFLKEEEIPIYISNQEADFWMPEFPSLKKTVDHEQIKIGNISIECLHTPGHTPGCQCYLVGDILLTGDVLFINGCGRSDLPGGNAREQYNSLYNILLKLPGDTVIYPGHNYGRRPFATLSELQKTNEYLTCTSMDEFLNERL